MHRACLSALIIASLVARLGRAATPPSRAPLEAVPAAPVEPNLLLHTGFLDDIAVLAMGALRGEADQPQATALRLLAALEESHRSLAAELEARRERLRASPEWLARHDAFVRAQAELFAEARLLLLDLSAAGKAEQEAAARKLLGWIERELGRNGIDLASLPRPIEGGQQKSPRRPVTDRSLVRPAAGASFAAVSPADTRPDAAWQNRWAAIRAQAARFADADAIVSFVRDEIELEPGFGFLQHPLSVLHRGRGSDFDQAALLVALLRAKDVPARFLYVAVRMGRDNGLSLFGTGDLIQAGQLMSAEGRPAVLVREQGDRPPNEAHLEHIVVERYVASRRGWVLEDPSFGGRVSPRAGGPPAAALSAPASVAAALDELTEGAMEEWRTLLIRASVDLQEAARLESAAASAATLPAAAGSGPAPPPGARAAPYQIMAYLAEFQALPEKLCVQLDLVLTTSEGRTRLGPFPLAGLDPPLVELDAVDADAAATAGSAPDPLGERAHYLVRLAPRWRLPGEPERVVTELTCRSTFPWSLAVSATRPFLPARTVRKSLRPGSLLALAWGASPGGDPLSAPAAVALGYMGALDRLDGALGPAARVAGIPEPPVVAASTLERLYDHPLELYGSRGLQLTVDQLLHSRSCVPLQAQGDGNRYVLAAGMAASALEHRILERIAGASAISTVKLLGEAVLDPQLRAQSRVVQSAGHFGLQLLPPVTLQDWTGSAELILALPSLAGRYDLSGRIAGGVVTRRIPEREAATLAQHEIAPQQAVLPAFDRNRVAAMACGIAALYPSILLARPAAIVHACWTSSWLVDGWLPVARSEP